MRHQQSMLLPTELVDAKVEVSVSCAIAPVIEQIINLRQEMRQEMHQGFSALKEEMHEMRTRLAVVETTLGIRQEARQQLRTHFLDYSFKAGWIIISAILSGSFSLLVLYLH
jgi:hypothetical protein